MKLYIKTLFVLLVLLALLVFAVPALALSGVASGTKAEDVLNVELTPETLLIIGGVVLSALVKYIPGLNTWYVAKTKEWQQLVMLFILLIVLVAVFTLNCYGLITSNLTCSTQGAVNALMVFVLTIASNQGAYNILPDSKAVKLVKATRKALEIKVAASNKKA